MALCARRNLPEATGESECRSRALHSRGCRVDGRAALPPGIIDEHDRFDLLDLVTVPLTMRIDLRQRLGAQGIPPPLEPVEGVLM